MCGSAQRRGDTERYDGDEVAASCEKDSVARNRRWGVILAGEDGIRLNSVTRLIRGGPVMKKVLVADDKATGRELIRTVLEQCGYSVFEAVDGMEAVRKARELLPDLIILDLHMPELDGFGAFREIRADERFTATPIMALTASAMRGDHERALSAGFTSYLTKPIGLNVLRSEVKRLLHQGVSYASGC